MKKTIKSTSLILALAMLFSLFAGCAKDDYAMVSGDTKYPVEPYAFYAYYYRDLWRTQAYYYMGQDDIDKLLDEKATNEGETLEQLIISQTEDQYVSYVIINKEFERLGLSIPDDIKKEIDEVFETTFEHTYSETELDNIYKTLNVTADDIKEILSVNYKREMIVDHYFGEDGPQAVTEETLKNNFQNNYARFKYIALAKMDDEGKNLSAEEISKKYNLAKEINEKVESGEDFVKLIEEYSEAYVRDTDSLSETEKNSAEKTNIILTEDGIIVNKDGTILQDSFYNSASKLDTELVNKIFATEISDTAYVETDTGFWIIQRCDNFEYEKYYKSAKEIIFDNLISEPYTELFDGWKKELSYTMNEKVVEKYGPKNIQPLFTSEEKLKEGLNSLIGSVGDTSE